MPHRDNLLLASLSPADLAALRPHLKLVHFDQEQVLFEAGDTIDATYFPTSASYFYRGHSIEWPSCGGRDGRPRRRRWRVSRA